MGTNENNHWTQVGFKDWFLTYYYSSAVPVAVALFSKEFKQLKDISKVVIIISGGNVDFQKLPFT